MSFSGYTQYRNTEGNFIPPDSALMVFAQETSELISVDGKLNELSWSKTRVVEDFFRMEPVQGGEVRYKTQVRILFDKKNLYFGVFCKDSIGKKGIRVQDLRRDFLYGENDVFYLQLDPQNLKRYCVSFQTTPYGNQRDVQVFEDILKDNDWDALWKVRTSITDSGYYAEFAIPFSSLRYQRMQNADSVSWGITFARLARREYEQTVFPAIPQAFSPYRMTYAAQLKGLKLPKPSLNVRAQPYVLIQSDQGKDQNRMTSQNSKIKYGGDIKMAITPNSVLDLTFNTDFAQTDVDRAVNNITRFNILFPERRQFFLENSGIYAGANYDGIKPFFSRTIGLSNAQFNASPVPIDFGARYTNRTQKNTIAGLYVHQRGTQEQSAVNFAVFRYLKNYGKQSNIGLMLTHRLDEKNVQKNFLAKNNTTLTIDGFSRPNDNWTIEYMLSASRNNSDDSIGVSAYFFVGWTPQKAYLGSVSKYVDQKYYPGMGFVFANNTIHHNPGGYYIWRPKGKLSKLIRRYDPGVFVNWYQNANDLRTQEVNLYIFPIYFITATNGKIEASVTPSWLNLSNAIAILGKNINAGKYQYLRGSVEYKTDQSKKTSAAIQYEFGDYYNGSLSSLTFESRVAPSPYFALTGSAEFNRFKNFGRFNESFNTNLYTGSIRVAYNPRLQLSCFFQYNTFDERVRLNVRGSWEFSPLSFVHIVFNQQELMNIASSEQSFIMKFSYMKQF